MKHSLVTTKTMSVTMDRHSLIRPVSRSSAISAWSRKLTNSSTRTNCVRQKNYEVEADLSSPDRQMVCAIQRL